MNKKRKITVDSTKLGYNPLANEFVIDVTKVIDDKAFIPDKDGVAVPVSSLLEKTKATKVYYSAGAKDAMYNLSAVAKCMYLFLIYNVKPNQDWIQIDPEWYMKKNNVNSINTYKKAVTELCRYLFIARSEVYKNVFWINPKLFFNGNRVRKYKEKVIISNTWEK